MGDVTSYDWNDSKIVCDCTHQESEHVSGYFCIRCSCTRYSQELSIRIGTEEYLGRLLLYTLKGDLK